MRNAFTANELNIIRKRPQSAVWRVAVHKPASVCILSKTANLSTYPASAFIGSVFSGASANIKAGMTAWAGTLAGGSDLGKIRVRGTYAESTSELPIAEAGSGLINWPLVFYVTVIDEFRPWTKHPKFATGTSQWLMDYEIAYNKELEEYGPLAQLGPPIVGFLDNGSFAASFTGDRSQSMGTSGNTISSQEWTFPDGQIVTSLLGTSDNPVVMSFTEASPGGSYFSLKVTDATGASHIGRRLIWLFKDRTQPPRVQIANIQGGIQTGGYKTSVRVASASASEEDFPSGAEMVIFEEASYNATASEIGGNFPFRSNIVFRGWITDEITRISPFTTDTLFNAQTINGIMARAPSYDVFHDLANPPTGASHWVEAASLSLDRTAWDLLKNRSTVGDICDFQPASGLAITEQIEYQSLPRSSWWEQIRQNYRERGLLGYVAADLQSNIYAFEDVTVSGGSANIPAVMELQQRDRRDMVQIVSDHIDRNAQVRMYAVTSVTPLGAESPGTVQGYWGGKVEQQRGLLVSDQDTLITWSGNLRAKLNNDYGKVVVPLSGNIRFDPVPQSRVTMSLSPVDNSRRIGWSNKQFVANALTLSYDATNRYVNSQIELEAIVDGAGGSAITFPTLTELKLPPPPVPDINPAPIIPDPGSGQGTVYAVSDSEIMRTRNLSVTSPAWSDISSGVSGTIYDFILDPFRPATTGYVLTDAGVYKSTNLDLASPTWAQVLSSATITTAIGGFYQMYKIIASINQDGYVGFACANVDIDGNGGDKRMYYIYSIDNGDSWTYVDIAGTAPKTWHFAGGMDYVPHLVNNSIRLYIVIEYDDGAAATPRLYRSDNKGASWSLMAATPVDPGSNKGGVVVHCPYNGNESGNIVYWGTEPASTKNSIDKSTDGGATKTTLDLIAVNSGLDNGGTRVKRTGIESHTQDKNQLYVWQAEDVAQILVSNNGGNSWTKITTSGITGTIRASGGFPYNDSQFYALTTNGVFLSTDRGKTWTDKTGNWSVTTISRFHGTIVPLWTE